MKVSNKILSAVLRMVDGKELTEEERVGVRRWAQEGMERRLTPGAQASAAESK